MAGTSFERFRCNEVGEPHGLWAIDCVYLDPSITMSPLLVRIGALGGFMAKRGRRSGAFLGVMASLRKAEQALERQLAGIKQAISSLEFGGFAAPSDTRRGRKISVTANANGRPRKRRKLSAKARRAISLAQKKRWAKLRSAKDQ